MAVTCPPDPSKASGIHAFCVLQCCMLQFCVLQCCLLQCCLLQYCVLFAAHKHAPSQYRCLNAMHPTLPPPLPTPGGERLGSWTLHRGRRGADPWGTATPTRSPPCRRTSEGTPQSALSRRECRGVPARRGAARAGRVSSEIVLHVRQQACGALVRAGREWHGRASDDPLCRSCMCARACVREPVCGPACVRCVCPGTSAGC